MDDVRRYLGALLATVRDVLGGQLTGAYAGGSLGLMAYQPGLSDIDVALVSATALPRHAKRELVRRLRHEALPCPARGLELVVYRREVAASGTPEPGFEIELNTGPAMDFRATFDPRDRPRADGRFWYGLDRSILHQSGRALLGPPAPKVFADLDPQDLRGLLVDSLTWWLARPEPAADCSDPGAADAILAACRALVRYRDGRWLSKTAAGNWLVLIGHPAAHLITGALDARFGGLPPAGPEARAFQRQVRREIRAGRAGRAG